MFNFLELGLDVLQASKREGIVVLLNIALVYGDFNNRTANIGRARTADPVGSMDTLLQGVYTRNGWNSCEIKVAVVVICVLRSAYCVQRSRFTREQMCKGGAVWHWHAQDGLCRSAYASDKYSRWEQLCHPVISFLKGNIVSTTGCVNFATLYCSAFHDGRYEHLRWHQAYTMIAHGTNVSLWIVYLPHPSECIKQIATTFCS